MFDNEIDIYHHIGQSMFNALPDEWDSAYFYFRMLNERGSCEYVEGYLLGSKDYDFSVNEIDGEYEDSKCTEAFRRLYKNMKKNESDVPWNKARFELKPDGDFDIQFKYDKDFEWLVAVDHCSDAYERLSSDDMSVIKSWEGIPEDFNRYWLT